MEQWNKVRGFKCFPRLYHKYLSTANENLSKMEPVLDLPELRRHKQIIISAFGQQAYDDINQRNAIKANIAQMKAANIPVRPARGGRGDFDPPRSASGQTKFVRTRGRMVASTVQFANRFYSENCFSFVDQYT